MRFIFIAKRLFFTIGGDVLDKCIEMNYFQAKDCWKIWLDQKLREFFYSLPLRRFSRPLFRIL